jgi:hypothetical protein
MNDISLTQRPMVEFRKEFFADERDDNLNEIGKPTQRQDALGVELDQIGLAAHGLHSRPRAR